RGVRSGEREARPERKRAAGEVTEECSARTHECGVSSRQRYGVFNATRGSARNQCARTKGCGVPVRRSAFTAPSRTLYVPGERNRRCWRKLLVPAARDLGQADSECD